ncbi:hypothetical protein VUR80DRAFT_6942 [Thermomyces stellatus]
MTPAEAARLRAAIHRPVFHEHAPPRNRPHMKAPDSATKRPLCLRVARYRGGRGTEREQLGRGSVYPGILGPHFARGTEKAAVKIFGVLCPVPSNGLNSLWSESRQSEADGVAELPAAVRSLGNMSRESILKAPNGTWHGDSVCPIKIWPLWTKRRWDRSLWDRMFLCVALPHVRAWTGHGTAPLALKSTCRSLSSFLGSLSAKHVSLCFYGTKRIRAPRLLKKGQVSRFTPPYSHTRRRLISHREYERVSVYDRGLSVRGIFSATIEPIFLASRLKGSSSFIVTYTKINSGGIDHVYGEAKGCR